MNAQINGLVLAVLVAVPAATGCAQAPADHGPGTAVGDRTVTPVEGPSVLRTLGLSVDNTRFGKLGGSAPAPPTAREEPMPPLGQAGGAGQGLFSRLLGWGRATTPTAQPFVLTGEDLYRVSCQSCHGPHGAGSPPQVNSLVGPVEGTSTELLVQRMRKAGRPVDVPFLRGVTAGAASDLRQRIQQGGEKMPSFGYLTTEEVDALVAYLQRMVGAPDAPASDSRLTLSADAVGELVARGTCHTCHDATGPGRHTMMTQAVTPSLASMPEQEDFDDVVNKVRNGISPPMRMMSMGPSKMPELPYITREELAAAMLYLMQYPPRQ
jgi:mono/diheme cytochrome c family protein